MLKSLNQQKRHLLFADKAASFLFRWISGYSQPLPSSSQLFHNLVFSAFPEQIVAEAPSHQSSARKTKPVALQMVTSSGSRFLRTCCEHAVRL